MIDDLRLPLQDGDLRLEPLAEARREELRAACALDRDIWSIYSRSYTAEHFDPGFDAMLADGVRAAFAVILGDALIGMTSYMDVSAAHRRLEIGTTYLIPAVRGSGVNARIKRLMLDRAFVCGIERVELRVDARNARSQAAVTKLGAVREGVLRRHMITWTGHIRDSVIFSILRDEWSNRIAVSEVSVA